MFVLKLEIQVHNVCVNSSDQQEAEKYQFIVKMLKTILTNIAQTRRYYSGQIFRTVPLQQQGEDIKLRGRFDNLNNSLSQPLSLTRPYLAGSEAASLPELLQYATDQDCLALHLDKVMA